MPHDPKNSPDVKFREGSGVGFATLENPTQINALTLEMVELLHRQLEQWERDPRVQLVILDGSGNRGFCVGGDVRKVHLHRLERENAYARAFFESEYRLDYLIHTYKKPLLVWGEGMVMGGGLGLLVGASCRVVTDSTVVAMPEIHIGFIPDVGGTYFLNKEYAKLGLFIALTASRLGAHDTLYMEWADYWIDDSKKENVYNELAKVSWSQDPIENKTLLREKVAHFARSAGEIPCGPLQTNASLIQRDLNTENLNEVWASLRELSRAHQWIAQGLENLLKGSPTSAHLIFEQLRRGRDFNLAKSFRLELTLALQCMRHHDFYEGVRAVLVEKDQHPRWKPASWEEVTTDLIEEHFAPSWKGPHPLEDLGERLA